jgi:hypothetical protein
MEQLYAAADTASRIYAASWRCGNIARCQSRLREKTLTQRLRNFYLDEIDREVDFILFKDNFDAA